MIIYEFADIYLYNSNTASTKKAKEQDLFEIIALAVR